MPARVISLFAALFVLSASPALGQVAPPDAPALPSQPGEAGVEPPSGETGNAAPPEDAAPSDIEPAASENPPAPAEPVVPAPTSTVAGPPEAATSSDELQPAAKKSEEELQHVKVFGFLQVHYRRAFAAGADQNVDHDDFRVQRARIGLKGDIFRWLGYDIEVDPRAPQITGVLRDAYIALHLIPRHEIRVGQQKTQFGYENPESSAKLYEVNRSEVSDNLSRGGVTLRDIGLGLLGNIKLGGGFRIEDAITIVNGDGMNVQADSTAMKDVWGRVGGRYKNDDLGNLSVRVGVSGGIGDFIDEGDNAVDPADDFRLKFTRVGMDTEIDQDWFFVSAEYVAGVDKDTVSGESQHLSGYYINVVGKLPWQVGPLVRYDTLGSDFKRWTFGVFYGLPNEPFRLLLNYEYRQLRDGVRADDKLYLWAQVRF